MSLRSSGLVVGSSPVLLWGMTSRERLRRLLVRAGIADIGFDSADPLPAEGTCLVVHAGWVFDRVLIDDLAEAPGTVLVDPLSGAAVAAHVPAARRREAAEALGHGHALADLRQVGPAELSGTYNTKLRKREAPYLLRLTEQNRDAIERRMFAGSYKGVTDIVTKHVWPDPARHVTRLCANAGISPNQVTWASFALVLATFLLFWNGQFALGLVAAWGMTFLDTVDGKLARVTLTSSRFGDAFDHGLDLIHPPFWWWAGIVGLGPAGEPLSGAGLVLAILVAGYIAQRLQEGLFLALFKIEIHTWRKFDSSFRLITARRNPNLILLTLGTLVDEPDTGMLAVAVWTAICFVVHSVQIGQALAMRRREPIVSWLAR